MSIDSFNWAPFYLENGIENYEFEEALNYSDRRYYCHKGFCPLNFLNGFKNMRINVKFWLLSEGSIVLS